MTNSRETPVPHRPARREIVLAAAGLVSLIGCQLLVSRSGYLFRRHFWLDEIITHALVVDGDLVHAMRAWAGGVESNPPTLNFLLRAFTVAAGSANETALRSFALLAVGLALLGIYCLLRQAYAPLVSATAVLAVWCHPLILRQAFEARFYAPWFAAVAWLAYFLVRARDPVPRPVLYACLAACALLVCTIHYLGIISLGLVTAFEFWFRHPNGPARLRGLGPITLGCVVLMACIPLLLKQQAGLTGATWVESPSVQGSLNFLNAIFLPRYLGWVVLVAWLSWLFRSRPADAAGEDGAGDFSRLGGVTGLVLMPLVLIGLSYTVKPVLVPRYSIPVVAVLAPAVAFMMYRASRVWLVALCVFLVAVSTRDLHAVADESREEDRVTEQLIRSIRQETGKGLVVFETQHQLYRVCYYAPDLAGRCHFLDFETGQFGPVTDYRIFNRDLARIFQAFYGTPGLTRWDVLKTLPQFYLVRHVFTNQGDQSPPAYPGFSARRVNGDLYLLSAPRRSGTAGADGPGTSAP